MNLAKPKKPTSKGELEMPSARVFIRTAYFYASSFLRPPLYAISPHLVSPFPLTPQPFRPPAKAEPKTKGLPTLDDFLTNRDFTGGDDCFLSAPIISKCAFIFLSVERCHVMNKELPPPFITNVSSLLCHPVLSDMISMNQLIYIIIIQSCINKPISYLTVITLFKPLTFVIYSSSFYSIHLFSLIISLTSLNYTRHGLICGITLYRECRAIIFSLGLSSFELRNTGWFQKEYTLFCLQISQKWVDIS